MNDTDLTNYAHLIIKSIENDNPNLWDDFYSKNGIDQNQPVVKLIKVFCEQYRLISMMQSLRVLHDLGYLDGFELQNHGLSVVDNQNPNS